MIAIATMDSTATIRTVVTATVERSLSSSSHAFLYLLPSVLAVKWLTEERDMMQCLEIIIKNIITTMMNM